MQKILIALDNGRLPEGVLHFASQLHKEQPIFLVGAFLPMVDYSSLWSYATGGASGQNYIPLVEEATAVEITKQVREFEKFCKTNNIQYAVHRDYFDFAVPSLRKESVFADLMLLSGELFYGQAGANRINDYLRETLHHAGCPVLVVPEAYTFPGTNILSYDGSASSVYAIKQFAYLMPHLAKNPSILIYASEKENTDLPNQEAIDELTARHYPNLTIEKLERGARKLFDTWISEKPNPILISGAFGRSDISMAFKESFVTKIICEHKLPLFIAHK